MSHRGRLNGIGSGCASGWVMHDPLTARKLAEQVIAEAARTKDNPPDLINVA